MTDPVLRFFFQSASNADKAGDFVNKEFDQREGTWLLSATLLVSRR